MRSSLTTCYSKHAIKVSDSYCSPRTSNRSYHSPNSKPSIINSVTNIYQVKLSSLKTVFVTIAWCNKLFNPGFSIAINDSMEKSNSNPQFQRKSKGSKSFNAKNSKIELHWDLSSANYDPVSPEPISEYYLLVRVDSERVLLIPEKEESLPLKATIVSRIVQISGDSEFSTRGKFSDSGNFHDIVFKYSVGEDGKKNSELSVSIDKKKMIEVKRLKWNFRGNQIIFLDGLLIDLMWDLHDWFFKEDGVNGYGVFMFRTRSGLDSRLWLQDKDLGFKQQQQQQQEDFSLLICACKNNPG